MKNPKEIETLVEKSTYGIPVYKVSDEGLIHEGNITLGFCKGNKEDTSVRRQTGFLPETLLATCNQYLVENNVGDLQNEDTTKAIKSIENALQHLQDRADKRKAAGVQGTYKSC
jgi:hypothetical protein